MLGELVLEGDGAPTPLLCDNETNAERLWGQTGRSLYPKDGINDHVVDGRDTVNPAGEGTKGALHYVLDVPAARARRRSGCGWRRPGRRRLGAPAGRAARPRRRLRRGPWPPAAPRRTPTSPG